MPSPPTKGDWKFLIGHGELGSRGGGGKRIGGTRITASADDDTTSIRRGGAWFSWCHMAEMNPSRLVRPSRPCSLEREEGGRTRKRWHTKAGGRSRGKDLARDSSFSQLFDKQTSGNRIKPKHFLFNLANLSFPSSPTPFSPKFFCANTAARVEATAKEARVGQKLTKDLSPHQSPLPPPFSPSPSCAPPLPLRALIMQPTLASCFSPLQELFSRRRKGGIRVYSRGKGGERLEQSLPQCFPLLLFHPSTQGTPSSLLSCLCIN